MNQEIFYKITLIVAIISFLAIAVFIMFFASCDSWVIKYNTVGNTPNRCLIK